MTFNQRRKGLLKAMQRITGNKGISIVIPWRKCLDVPRFLRRLDLFEKRSRKSKLVILFLCLLCLASGCSTTPPTPTPAALARRLVISIRFAGPPLPQTVQALRRAGATQVSALAWTLEYDWRDQSHGAAIHAANAEPGRKIGPLR